MSKRLKGGGGEQGGGKRKGLHLFSVLTKRWCQGALALASGRRRAVRAINQSGGAADDLLMSQRLAVFVQAGVLNSNQERHRASKNIGAAELQTHGLEHLECWSDFSHHKRPAT